MNPPPDIASLRKRLRLDGQGLRYPWQEWVREQVFVRRLNTVWGWLLLGAISLGVAVLVAKVNWVFGILIAAGVIGAPILFSAMFKLEMGIYLMITLAFFMSVFLKLFSKIPVGLVMDFTILLMMLGIVYKGIKTDDWTAFRTPITYTILVWMAYHFFEFLNPQAASRAAWFYVVRPAVGYILLFFACYAYLRTLRELKRLLIFLVLLSAVSGIWGIYQFLFGYFDFEMRDIVLNQQVHLVYIQGRWRSFGTMGSPAQYGVVMAYTILFSLVLLGVKFPKWFRFFLYLNALISLMAMVYSGTRAGYVLIPLGIMVMVGLARNVKLYVLCAIGGVAAVGVINMPTSNYHILRIQSAFKGSEDESYKVRKRNKEMIMPWIAAHPIGGGLGSTGVWGQRFSPGTFLANFPPDAGYIRVAVEMGWIGLIIYLALWINIMVFSIIGYLRMKDKELKAVALGILVCIAPLMVIEYAQDIIGKLPSNLLFWVQVALLVRAVEIDLSNQKKEISIN